MRNPEAVAWVVAAEGCISIYRRVDCRSVYSKFHGGLVTLRPMVNVSNTKVEFIENFKELAGIGHVSGGNRMAARSNCNPIYDWCVSSIEDCFSFVTDIQAFLPIKQEQACVILEFCERSMWRNGSALEDRDFELYEKMRELNRRGTGNGTKTDDSKD